MTIESLSSSNLIDPKIILFFNITPFKKNQINILLKCDFVAICANDRVIDDIAFSYSLLSKNVISLFQHNTWTGSIDVQRIYNASSHVCFIKCPSLSLEYLF